MSNQEKTIRVGNETLSIDDENVVQAKDGKWVHRSFKALYEMWLVTRPLRVRS